MILYGSSMSPFVRKVLAYASERGIELESRPIGVGADNAEFRAASPFGKMPALVDGDFGLADSSAIIHYLEAKYPDGVLIPAEAKARGRTIWFEEFSDTIVGAAMGKMFFNRIVAPVFMKREGNAEIAAAAEREELPPILDYLERTIPDGESFLVGDSLTLADIALASPLANLRHLGIEIDADRYPRTRAFTGRILARESFDGLLARETKALERLAA